LLEEGSWTTHWLQLPLNETEIARTDLYDPRNTISIQVSEAAYQAVLSNYPARCNGCGDDGYPAIPVQERNRWVDGYKVPLRVIEQVVLFGRNEFASAPLPTEELFPADTRTPTRPGIIPPDTGDGALVD
jgi:hypothetical protein